MQESAVEKKINELLRRGDIDKARLLQGLRKRIMPTQVQRILRNDKTVMQEIVLPDWLSWDLLRIWAQENSALEQGTICALCSHKKEIGVKFNGKFICEQCFKEVRNVPASSAPQ